LFGLAGFVNLSRMGASEPPSSSEVWYFAYGSNMCRSVFRERRGISPRAALPARLEHHRLRFNLPVGPGERGVANVEPDPGVHTYGVLYLITTDQAEHLDRTEGVPNGFYQRIDVEVLARREAGVEALSAFTYRSLLTQEGRKPSARYMRFLLEGARENGLPAEYLESLEQFALARDEREAERREGH
jgi:cation transport regulator ChaC